MAQAADQTTIKFDEKARTFTAALGPDGRIVLNQSAGRTEQVMGVENLQAAARSSDPEGRAMFEQKAIGLQQRVDQTASIQINPSTPGFTMVPPKGPAS